MLPLQNAIGKLFTNRLRCGHDAEQSGRHLYLKWKSGEARGRRLG